MSITSDPSTTVPLDVRASWTARDETPAALAAEVAADLRRATAVPAVVLRGDGAGHLAVGLAGDFSAADAAALADLLDRHRSTGRRGLTVELGALRGWVPALARVLGRVRIRHLVRGASVTLHDAPPALLEDLGRPGAVAFDVSVGRWR